jgi:hypothetical protein
MKAEGFLSSIRVYLRLSAVPFLFLVFLGVLGVLAVKTARYRLASAVLL